MDGVRAANGEAGAGPLDVKHAWSKGQRGHGAYG